MEDMNIWTAFGLALFFLYLFLGAYHLYYTNSQVMKRKGYTDEYIKFLKKDIRNRVIGISIALPIIMVMAGFFTNLIFGYFDFLEGKQMLCYFCFFFILVLPFPILDNRSTQKKYKKLAMDSGSEIVLDFNYKHLHRIFSPQLEVPATLLFIAYFVLLLKDFHVAFLHFLILWILYFTLRNARYLVKPALKDAYLYTFVFLFLNQALLIFYLVREFVSHAHKLTFFITGLIIMLFLSLKLVYYLIGFISVKKELG